MKLVTLDNHQLTWDSRPFPTEAGVAHLPEYGGFEPTPAGRAALHSPPRHQARKREAEEWPVDPPFEDD
jgi:hypothetical protein